MTNGTQWNTVTGLENKLYCFGRLFTTLWSNDCSADDMLLNHPKPVQTYVCEVRHIWKFQSWERSGNARSGFSHGRRILMRRPMLLPVPAGSLHQNKPRTQRWCPQIKCALRAHPPSHPWFQLFQLSSACSCTLLGRISLLWRSSKPWRGTQWRALEDLLSKLLQSCSLLWNAFQVSP